MNIQYLHGKELGMELIVCRSSLLSYPIHNHVSVFTVGIVLDGALDLTVEKTARRYRGGDAFVIPPYVPHKMTACEKYTLLCCCINKGTVAAASLREMKEAAALLLNEAVIRRDINREQAGRLMASLDLLQQAPLKTGFPGPYPPALIERLESYPEEQFPIDEMARAAFMSKYYFIRRFKEETGLTPHQFLMQNRVRKAQRFIKEYDTITEVALNTGFCDQSHLIKTFEKIVGLTPAAYKTAYSPISINGIARAFLKSRILCGK